MSKIVEGLYYSENHEWIKVDGDLATIGVTDHAQGEMGDVVYVDCGTVGALVSKGDAVAVVESVKAASDVYTPVSGEITAVNDELSGEPEKINADAFGAFLFTVKMSDSSQLAGLMNAGEYKAFCQE